MKILHVIDTLNVGGAERMFVDIANMQHEANLHVEILLLYKSGKLESDLNKDIKIHHLNRSNKLSLAKLYQTNELCKNFDIVHVHMRHNMRYVGLANMLFGGKQKLVFHDQYGDIEQDKKIPFMLDVFIKKHFYIGIHDDLVNWARAIQKTNNKSLKLPNISITPTIYPNKKSQESQHRKLIMVANFRNPKNHLLAVDTLSKLRAYGDYSIDFYGNINDEQYNDRVMARIKELNLTAHINIISGVSDIQSKLSEYDLAIHTSTRESGPIVLLEFMGQNLPFLSYTTGEVCNTLGETLKNNFINSLSPESWAKRISEIMEEKKTVNLAALKEEFYGKEQYLNKCLQFYKQVLDNKHAEQ